MDPEDLTDEQLEQILNSKIVVKYLAYRNLTDGIEALKDDGVMYDTFIEGVDRRVGGRLSRDSVEKVVQAMIEEVEANTEFVESVEDDESDPLWKQHGYDEEPVVPDGDGPV